MNPKGGEFKELKNSQSKRWRAQNTTNPEHGELKGEPKGSKPQRWGAPQKDVNPKTNCQLSKNTTQKIHKPPKKKTPQNCEPQKTLNPWNNMNTKGPWVLPKSWICWQYGWLFQPNECSPKMKCFTLFSYVWRKWCAQMVLGWITQASTNLTHWLGAQSKEERNLWKVKRWMKVEPCTQP